MNSRTRIALGVIGAVILIALVLAGVVRTHGGHHHIHRYRNRLHVASTASAEATGRAETEVGSPPPNTSDPLTFAKAAAALLWSYDTRTVSRNAYLAQLRGWLSDDRAHADPGSVEGRVPDPVVWSRMHDTGQYAEATADAAHVPAQFRAAVAQDPEALHEAYVYAVTVTGSQRVRWHGGDSGPQDQAVTLAVQCRPEQPCRLAGVAPTVAP